MSHRQHMAANFAQPAQGQGKGEETPAEGAADVQESSEGRPKEHLRRQRNRRCVGSPGARKGSERYICSGLYYLFL